MSTRKEKEPDPFALEVDNNEYIAAVHRLESEGKKIHRIDVAPHGYVLRFYIPAPSAFDHLVDLLLDYNAEETGLDN